MKKIKSIKQLQAEKRRIKQHQDELERKIRNSWSDLKEYLKPAHIAGDAFNSVLKNKTSATLEGDGILKNTVAYGISLLAQKLADIAGEKLEKVFKKK